MHKNNTGTSNTQNSQVTDIKTNTNGIITTLIIAGIGIAAFLVFVAYYAILWTPGKPLEMMQ